MKNKNNPESCSFFTSDSFRHGNYSVFPITFQSSVGPGQGCTTKCKTGFGGASVSTTACGQSSPGAAGDQVNLYDHPKCVSEARLLEMQAASLNDGDTADRNLLSFSDFAEGVSASKLPDVSFSTSSSPLDPSQVSGAVVDCLGIGTNTDCAAVLGEDTQYKHLHCAVQNPMTFSSTTGSGKKTCTVAGKANHCCLEAYKSVCVTSPTGDATACDWGACRDPSADNAMMRCTDAADDAAAAAKEEDEKKAEKMVNIALRSVTKAADVSGTELRTNVEHSSVLVCPSNNVSVRQVSTMCCSGVWWCVHVVVGRRRCGGGT